MPNPGTIYGTHHLTFCVGDRAGGLRLPRPHARPQEHQEDRAVRRRDPRLPPLLRQPHGRREHDLHRLPLPPRGLDGQARHQPAAHAQRVRAGRLARLLGRSPARRRAGGLRVRALRHPAAGLRPPVRHPVHARGRDGARRPRAVGRRRRARRARDPRRLRHHDLGARARADGLLPARGVQRPPPRPPTARTTSTRSAPARGTAASSSWSRSPTARRARGSSARARSTTTRSTRAPRRTRRCSRTTSSGSASPTSPTSRTAATSSRCTCARRAARCSSWPTATEQGFLIDEAARRAGHAHVHPAALGGPPARDRAAGAASTRSRRCG